MPIFVALEKETFGIISQTTNESLDTVYNIQFALIKPAETSKDLNPVGRRS